MPRGVKKIIGSAELEQQNIKLEGDIENAKKAIILAEQKIKDNKNKIRESEIKAIQSYGYELKDVKRLVEALSVNGLSIDDVISLIEPSTAPSAEESISEIS